MEICEKRVDPAKVARWIDKNVCGAWTLAQFAGGTRALEHAQSGGADRNDSSASLFCGCQGTDCLGRQS